MDKRGPDGIEWLIIAFIIIFGLITLYAWLGGPMPCFGAQCEGNY